MSACPRLLERRGCCCLGVAVGGRSMDDLDSCANELSFLQVKDPSNVRNQPLKPIRIYPFTARQAIERLT